MPRGPHFRTSVLAAKQRLAQQREKLRAQHDKGSPGVQVCARLTDLLDTIVVELFEAALADLNRDDLRGKVALTPHGGYGRREVAPYSDVDLMILHDGARDAAISELAKRLMQDLFDVGLVLGHSLRTPAQAVQLARTDAKICTSVIESRYLAGNEAIYRKFTERFRKMTIRRYRSLHEAIVEARRQERAQYGETVSLLKPNIKRSRGGLREIQLLRWIGFAKFGTSDVDSLQLLGALSKDDRRKLRAASEFLLRLRNEMHFHAGKAQDVLGRSEQVRLAETLGYQGRSGVRPVEQFMQEYFRHTGQVRYLVSRFVDSVRPAATVNQVLGPVFSRLVEGDYRVGWRQISATRQGLQKLKWNLDEVLRLADLANQHNKRIDHATWETVCRAAPDYPSEISPEVAKRFLSIMDQPAQLGELLRRLHELGVLEKIVPAFAHARGLLQFNEYHKYTVDEHSLRAVECATEFAIDTGPLGEAYRGIKQKRTLHLALLLHDLGKGFPEDHSEVGRQIAQETCRRLAIPKAEAELIEFLVHKHLRMSHLAFRRDTSHQNLVVQFAIDVGSPENLRMLYVLTAADLSAVGPGILNRWKVDVLTELYHRTMEHLAGDVAVDSQKWLTNHRDKVRACLTPAELDDWSGTHIKALPANYLQSQSPEKIADMLRRLRKLGPRTADAWGEYLPNLHAVEFTTIVDEGHGRGVFYRLTGGLTSQGLQILSAEINSLAGQSVIDRFVVEDPQYKGVAPPPERIQKIAEAMVHAIDSDEPPKFRKIWGSDQEKPAKHSLLTTEVRIDNTSSERHTILDVFTYDRTGLLYTIARTLFELRLSVALARIGTYLDQVVDVFYVTEAQGEKIQDESRLEQIRQTLVQAIESESS